MDAAASYKHGRHGWAWHIATVAGIPVRIHFTLFLLLLWFAWVEFKAGGAVLSRVLFITGIFSCVLLHEIGHALAARSVGIQTSEIVLYPFGGIARLRSMGRPTQELLISLAGPAVNVVIAAGLYTVLKITGLWLPLSHLHYGDPNFLQRLTLANLVLAAFNLIPAFPMDGGRAVRALLAARLGQMRGTLIAVTIGQAFAMLIGLAGLLSGNFMLVFIAFFVFVSASQELAAQQALARMRSISVGEVLTTSFAVLEASEPLSRAVEIALETRQQDFPVVARPLEAYPGAIPEEDVLGILTREDLLRGLSERGPTAPVGSLARRTFATLRTTDDLESAARALEASGLPVGLVFTRGYLVGMLVAETAGRP